MAANSSNTGGGTVTLRGMLVAGKSVGGWALSFVLAVFAYFDFQTNADAKRELTETGRPAVDFLTNYGGSIAWFALIVVAAWVGWRTVKLREIEAKLAAEEAQGKRLLAETVSLREAGDEATTRIHDLQRQLEQSIPYVKYPRGRWETFDKIEFGHLPYAPLLDYKPPMNRPKGLGVELLRRLLRDSRAPGKNIEIVAHPVPETWGSVLDGLVNGRYDIVATPLFATFERSKNVTFTMPLFFSNVGLFVSKAYADDHNLSELSLAELEVKLPQLGNLGFIAIDEEISEKLAEKYRRGKLLDLRRENSSLDSLFSEVSTTKSTPLAVFSETFFSHFNDHVKAGSVVNILRPQEILYPVCYALRLGDYQLVNLLNIRLLELTKDGGALKELAADLAATGEITVEQVYHHFVAQWPYEPVQRKAANA